jgi:hypothetical protein
MIAVQEYLHNGKTLEDLNKEFGIKLCYHSTLPLVILNYCQIDSPKINPITICCRGLILELNTWNIVARSFDRFFNLGEAENLQKDFDWSNFYALEKVDGSLCNMFFYAGEWHMATRGSFGDQLMENCDFSWKELFWKTFDCMAEFFKDSYSHDDENNFVLENLRKEFSYTYELCSPYNKIVTDYKIPRLFCLNYYDKPNNEQRKYGVYGAGHPKYYNFKSIDEVIQHIEDLELNNPTIEGLVLVDKNLNRIKVKNKKYLSLHRMRGESGFTMKNLLPFILDGETDEILTYYPELEPKISQMVNILSEVRERFVKVWDGVVFIEDQKEFAIKLNSFQFEFRDVFFTAKKTGIIEEGGLIWTSLVLKHNKLYDFAFKKFDK